MKDQELALQQRGVKVAVVRDLDEEKIENVKQGHYEVIYISPERILADTDWRDMLQSPIYQSNLVAIVVDEAHLVKKWYVFHSLCHKLICLLLKYRGKKFRKEFSNIGEIHSLIPSRVGIMALTATASRDSRSKICSVLCMRQPIIVSQSPNKPNIMYSVLEKCASAEDTFQPPIEEVREKGVGIDRVLIFCKTCEEVTHIYKFFAKSLGNAALHPQSAPDLVKHRIVDMFTACTHPVVKGHVVSAIKSLQSPLRIVLATIAFGMGIDCPNICCVIHWGVPHDVESYLQETGRAERDEKPAKAVLYHHKCDLKVKDMDETMRRFCTNDNTCRRSLLLQDFESDEQTVRENDVCM